MSEQSAFDRIGALVAEEHQLRQQLAAGEISSDQEQARLSSLEEALDQCWDLLRRRRAARAQGVDPDQLDPRPIDEVEGYLQ